MYSHLSSAFGVFKKNKRLQLLTLANSYSHGVGEVSFQFWPSFYASLLPLWAVGIIRMLGIAYSALSFFFAGKILGRFGHLPMIITGYTYGRFMHIFFLLNPSILAPFVMTTSSLFHGVVNVAKSTLVQKEFTDKQRATLGSLSNLGSQLIFAPVSIGIGFLADNFGIIPALITNQFIFIPVIFLFIYIFRRQDNKLFKV